MVNNIHNNYAISCFDFIKLLFVRVFWLFVIFIMLNFSVHAENREEYEMINITAGQVGILDDLEGQQRYGMEYRFTSFSGPLGFSLIPAIGAAAANNGARFIYTDLRHDFYLNDKWLLIPSFGVGVFNDSDEVNLGNSLEFRSGLEVAYQFQNKIRAGIAVFHLSNGGISSQNPGTEALVFSICIPVMGR
jgi:lipid A 3-O-deacylase